MYAQVDKKVHTHDAHWQQDLINSEPELLGRFPSVTLPDRGQQYAVILWPL